MFKRVVWTGVGYGLGLGSSVYVQRKVKKTVERYTPEHLRVEAAERSKDAVKAVRDFGSDMIDTVQNIRTPDFGYHGPEDSREDRTEENEDVDDVEADDRRRNSRSNKPIDLRSLPSHRSGRRRRGSVHRPR